MQPRPVPNENNPTIYNLRALVDIPCAQISFRLAKPGFMRQFSGTWTIAPYDNASLDEMVNRHRPSALHRLQVRGAG